MEALVVTSKETGLEVNADKTEYMVMSRDQNAGRSHNIKIHKSSFGKVEEFKYLGTTLRDQNSIQEEIKSRLKSGNACYHLVQNLVSPRLVSKNTKIKIYVTIILPVVLYGCGTSPGLRHQFMFHNMICFYGEKLLAPHPSPKLEDHPCGLSTAAYSIYLQLPSILEAIRPSAT
jgi:hypothetical protein